MEQPFTPFRAHGNAQIDVAGPLAAEPFVKMRIGFHVHSPPTEVIEMLCNRGKFRIHGPDVDVEALGLPLKGTSEDDILKILSVRDHPRGPSERLGPDARRSSRLSACPDDGAG